MCDSNGIPQCADFLKIFMTSKAYPGETITIPTVIMGGDFGTTVGTVYIGFLGHNYQSSHKVSHYQTCTDIYYTLKLRNDISSSYFIMHLSTNPYDNNRFFRPNKDQVKEAIQRHEVLP